MQIEGINWLVKKHEIVQPIDLIISIFSTVATEITETFVLIKNISRFWFYYEGVTDSVSKVFPFLGLVYKVTYTLSCQQSPTSI